MKRRASFRTVMLTSALALVFAWALGCNHASSPSRGSPSGSPPDSEPKAEGKRSWIMFGGSPSRNMVNLVEKNIPAEWEIPNRRKGKAGKNIKWVADLGSQSYGNPVVHNGKIFLGTNNAGLRNKRDVEKDFPDEPADKGIIMCFRESDGEFLWQAVHDKLSAGRVVDWPMQGICSSPYIDGDRLYYVSNRCELVCADVEGLHNGNQGAQDEKYTDKTDADFIWRLNMMKDLNVFPHNLAVCSPLVIGDLVFVVTGNGVDEEHTRVVAPRAPSFIAVNKKTGAVVWKDSSPRNRILHGQWSNPCYVEIDGKGQVIFPGGDGWLYSFEPETGKLIWKFDVNPKEIVEYILGGGGLRNELIATPIVYENRVYVAVGQDPEHGNGAGMLWCVDATKTGDISPTLMVDQFADPPVTKPNPNSGAVWSHGGVDKTGKIVFHRSMSTCAVHDGLCYAANLMGRVVCLDAKTGQRYWEIDTKSAIWGSPTYIDGKIYIGTEDGYVWVFQAGKQGKKNDDGHVEPIVLAQIDMGNPVYSTPIAVNGVLYVMTRSNLFAIEAKK